VVRHFVVERFRCRRARLALLPLLLGIALSRNCSGNVISLFCAIPETETRYASIWQDIDQIHKTERIVDVFAEAILVLQTATALDCFGGVENMKDIRLAYILHPNMHDYLVNRPSSSLIDVNGTNIVFGRSETVLSTNQAIVGKRFSVDCPSYRQPICGSHDL
jgi:hypothetical protein